MGSPNCSEGGYRERWSEYGVGSLNSRREECRVIKEKEEVQEGNKRLEEKGGTALNILLLTHTVEYI